MQIQIDVHLVLPDGMTPEEARALVEKILLDTKEVDEGNFPPEVRAVALA